MPLQDLTPEIRTRLSRVERWVGLFVTAATLLLLGGLVYYVIHIAHRKGWFLQKAPYHTYVQNAAGLKVGDPVRMMGFEVGQITQIEAMPPGEYFNVYLQFEVREPYYGYLLTDSRAKVASQDFLGNRALEVTKGTWGQVTVLVRNDKIEGVLDHKIKTNLTQVPLENLRYVPLTNGSKGYWLSNDESPAVTERLEQVVDTVQAALPAILSLTNQLQQSLTNLAALTSHADELVLAARPTVQHFTQIASNLTQPKGALGEWLLPTNINTGLDQTLSSANLTLLTAQTNVQILSLSLNQTLLNLGAITSNLNSQVEANQNVLSEISSLVVSSDEMVQGLKRHWLLKGAFSNAPAGPTQPTLLQPRIARPE